MRISNCGQGAQRAWGALLAMGLALPVHAANEVSDAFSIEDSTPAVAVTDEAVEPASCDCGVPSECCESCGQGDCCCDSMGCCDTTCCGPVCCPPPAKRSFFYGEFLLLRPTDGDVAHAQQQNGIGGAGTVPFGQIGTVDVEYAPGVRVGGGIGLGPSSSLVSSFTWYEGDDDDSLNAPVIPGGGGAVGSLVHHPGAAITASTGPVRGDYDVAFRLADFGFRDVWVCRDWCELNYTIGGQFANIEQDFSQTGVFAGGNQGVIGARTNVEFNGGGLRAGLDGQRFLARGLRVYGRAFTSLLSGRANSLYTMRNNSTEADLAIAEWSDNRAIALTELELGVAKSFACDRFQISAGYLMQQWDNVVTTSEFIDAVQADNYTNLNDNLGFDGLTVRLEGRW